MRALAAGKISRQSRAPLNFRIRAKTVARNPVFLDSKPIRKRQEAGLGTTVSSATLKQQAFAAKRPIDP